MLLRLRRTPAAAVTAATLLGAGGWAVADARTPVTGPPPGTAARVAGRLALLPLFAGALVAIGWFARRFDGPWTSFSRTWKAVAGAAAGAFAVYAFGVL